MQTLSLTFQNPDILSDSYWVRLRQEEYQSDLISIAEVAEVLDSVYDIDPCENSDFLNGGGIPEPVEDSEEKLKEAFGALGYDPDPFDDYGRYTVTLYVYRSHMNKTYKLVLSTGMILQTVLKTKEVSEIVQVSGKKVTLNYTIYAGASTNAPGNITECNGSTVLLSEDVFGYYSFTYTTQYDEVTVKVSGKLTSEGWESQECLCTVFFQGLTDQLLISPPEKDNKFISVAGDTSDTEETSSETSDDVCYKGLDHTKFCNCGVGVGVDLDFRTVGGMSRVVEQYTEIIEVPCSEGGDTTIDGLFTTSINRTSVVEYVDCPDEFWEGSTEEFYIEKCCESPPYGIDFPYSLPKCLSYFRMWLGGVGINGGIEKYKNLYGENVRLIPISPEERNEAGFPICGIWETYQDVQAKNCCDDPSYEDIEINEDDSAEVIADYSYGIVFWTKGISPYTVSVAGGGFYLDELYTVKSAVTENSYIRVFTEDACGTCTVTIDDGCSTVSHIIMADSGVWVFDSNTCGLSPPGDVSELDSASKTSCSGGYHPGRFATNFAQYTKGHLRQKEWPTPCTDEWSTYVPGWCPAGCTGYFYDCPCSHNTCIAPCHIGCQTLSGSGYCYKVSWCSSPGVVELYKWSC
jgi:hypothetical protein